MENLVLETATLDDIDEIMNLEVLGFKPGIVERSDVFLGRIKHFPDGFLLIRDCCSRKALGYISSELWIRHETIKEEMFTLNHGIQETHSFLGTEIYVTSMTIHPNYRGCGLGDLIFSGCIRRLKNLYPKIDSSILIVNETWINAKKIYDKKGFEELFRIKGFFTPDSEPPQDALVMRKDIAFCSSPKVI
jgi:ribosomal-protein-alanine N-acetyltransferase